MVTRTKHSKQEPVALVPAQTARKRYLEILLDRLTGHADVMRHYLQHRGTLGFAAEAGVRDVLRQVLPRRLAVTSGFLRTNGGALIAKTPAGAMSPQTDIIIYDALRACPLYSVDGVEIIAASDALGVIEVKDSKQGEADLLIPQRRKAIASLAPVGEAEEGEEEADEADEESEDSKEWDAEETGALEHIVALSKAAPRAFRGIVLVQGGNIASARVRMEKMKLTEASVPHVVYCRSVVNTKTRSRKSYLAFHEHIENQVHFYAPDGENVPEYEQDRDAAINALAGFLRIITGFFAAQDLTTAALAADMTIQRNPSKKGPLPLQLAGRAVIPSLRDAILASSSGPPEKGEARRLGYREMVDHFFDQELRARQSSKPRFRFKPVVGLDPDGRPTAGSMVEVRWGDEVEAAYGSFFTMSEDGILTCADRPPADYAWNIVRESIDSYLRRGHKGKLDDSYFIDPEPRVDAAEAPDAPKVLDDLDDATGDDQKGA